MNGRINTSLANNKSEFRRNCIIIFAITSLLVAIFFLFNTFFITEGSNSLKITDWNYTGGEKINELKDRDRVWVRADTKHPVKIQDKEPYVILKGKLPKSEIYDTLAIKTSNSTISVAVDSEIIYNTLKKKPILAGSNISIINLPPSEEERSVEIILYAPLAFDVNIYMTTKQNASASAAAIPYFDVIFAVLFILVSLLVFLFTQKKTVTANKKVSICLLAVGIMAGISVLVNPVYTGIQVGDAVVMFKLGSFINVLVSGLILLLVLIEKVKWNSLIEGVIGINILYAVCIFCSPYDVLTIVMMKMCSIIQVGNFCIFIYMVIKHKLSISALDFAVYLCYAISSILHWYSIANQLRFEFRLPMLFAAVIFVVVSFVSRYIENNDEIYTRKTIRKKAEFKAKEIIILPEEESVDLVSEYTNKEIKIIIKPDTEIMAIKRYDGLVFSDINDVFDFYGVLGHIVSEKCDGKSHHLLHVAEYVRMICLHMGMNEERAMFVAKASLLHDIGKICIPQNVLLKTEALSEDEYNLIRSHNVHGYNILNNQDDRFLKMAAQIAREHHENYNGTGYLGLKGEEISLYARIVTVADVFDAVTSARAYKNAWSFEEGIDYIEKQKYDYFDPDIATVFISCQDEIYKIYKAFEINAKLYGM